MEQDNEERKPQEKIANADAGLTLSRSNGFTRDGIPLPHPDDPFLREYKELMKLPDHGEPLDYEVLERDPTRPANVPTISDLCRHKPCAQLQHLMNVGEVYMCHPHKIPIHGGNERFNEFASDQSTTPVKVRFAYLEGTLLPFGDESEVSSGEFQGTVPLEEPMPGFPDCNHDPDLQGYRVYLCKESNGQVRWFSKNETSQKVIRGGDILTIDELFSLYAGSGRTGNFVVGWILACKHRHEEMINVYQEMKDERKYSKSPNESQLCAEECTRLTKDAISAMEIHGPPPNPERSEWDLWNLADVSKDKYRTPAERQYAHSLREAAFVFNNILPNEEGTFLERCKNWGQMLILTLSQITRDKMTHAIYLRLTNGRLSMEEMLAPLARVGWYTYYVHLARTIRTSSIQHKKSNSVIALGVLTKGLYRGQLPLKAPILKAFPEIRDKKVSVVLLSFGLYRGIGPGTDSHLFRVWRSPVIEIWGRQNADGKTLWMGKQIPADVGREAK